MKKNTMNKIIAVGVIIVMLGAVFVTTVAMLSEGWS